MTPLNDGDPSLKAALGALSVVLLALLACKGPEAQNPQQKAELLKRAQFDLHCPDALNAVPLQVEGGWVRSYGVTGCGKRATYVLSPDNVWIMNTAPDGSAQVDPSLMKPRETPAAPPPGAAGPAPLQHTPPPPPNY
jgi:hypothetical protein